MILVPGTTRLLTGSKTGKAYLLNTGGLGGLVSGDTQLPQVFQALDTSVRPGEPRTTITRRRSRGRARRA